MGIQEKGGSENIYHLLDEADIDRILRHHTTMIGSDGGTGGAVPHPRSYGSFPRILRRYVAERNVLTLEDAIRRMTSMTAARLRLYDRGLVRPGLKADVVLFDPAVIADRATFDQPTEYAVGVRHVFVNGRLVLRDGILTNERPGQVIRRGEKDWQW
jgi:N-acyl-D-aspartate/D-glutamate deacylase